MCCYCIRKRSFFIFFFGFVVPEVAVSPQNPEAQPIRTGSVVVDLL